MTSKNENTNSPIHEFKVQHKGQRVLKNRFQLCIISYFKCYFKKHVKVCFFILKALKDILHEFELVNLWFRFFDVTNKNQILEFKVLHKSQRAF